METPSRRVKVIEQQDNDYRIIFNQKTGEEITFGLDKKPDPFILEHPSMLDVGIMGHCENRCSFCYQGDKQEPNMKLDNFKQIVNETKDTANQFALGGRGDPNLHEDFDEILYYCRLNDIIPNYTTSGIGLTDYQIHITKECCGAVAVSDYSKDFTYRALYKFMKAGIKTNIHFVLSRTTIKKAIDILNGKDPWDGMIDLNRLNAIVFLLFKPQGRGKHLTNWVLPKDELKQFVDKITNCHCKFKIGMDSCLVNKIQSVRELTDEEKLCTDTCEGARMSCYITPDMCLVPCSFGDHDQYGVQMRPWNFLNKKSVYEAWHEKPFREFRRILLKERACCPWEKLGVFK